MSGDWSAEEAIQTDNLLIREALARLKAGQLLSNDHIQQLDYLVQRRQSAIQSNESVVAALKVRGSCGRKARWNGCLQAVP